MRIFRMLMLLTLAFSCGKRPEEVTIVLDWSLNTNHAGLIIARDQNYFKDEGLIVQIETPPETGAAALVSANQAQLGFSYQEEVTLAVSQNIPILAVAALIQHNTSGFASKKGEGIIEPKDFEGRIYGGWGSPTEEAVLRSVMEKNGGDFSLLRVQNIGSMDFFSALDSLVDFAWIFEGWTGVEAASRNFELDYIPLRTLDPALDYYTPVLIANSHWAEENPETLKAFLRALKKGYEMAKTDIETSTDIFVSEAKEFDKELILKSLEYLRERWVDDAPRWGEMQESRWVAFSSWLKERGLLSRDIPTDKLFTNGYLPE